MGGINKCKTNDKPKKNKSLFEERKRNNNKKKKQANKTKQKK